MKVPTNRQILERIEQTLEHHGSQLEAHGILLALSLQKDQSMADTLDDVVAEAERQTTVAEGTKVVIDHAVSLLDEIGAKLAQAGQDPAKLAALKKMLADTSAALSSEKDALAAAVERNTQFQPSGGGV